MMIQFVLGATLLVVAAVASWILNRRKPAPPPRDSYPVPRQLDRADFPRPDAPWLVVCFTSSSCEGCGPMAEKVAVLESASVATFDAEFSQQRDLHKRYKIEGVPLVVIADRQGCVRGAFVGKASATDLWAAVAELREPGSSPEANLGELPD